MGLIHSPRTVTDGLVLHLDAANIKSYPGSGTTITNMAPSSYNFTLANGPTYSSDNNGQWVLDGIDDTMYGNMGNFDFTKSGLSYSVWAKFFSYTNRQENILWKGVGLGRSWLYRNNGTITINSYFGSGKDFYLSTSGIQIVPSEWINITATFNRNDREKIYVNGEQKASRDISTASGDNWQNFNTLNISTSFNANSYPISGSIASISAYDRELTSQEIAQNFNALRGRFGI